jgi:CheY-like chemotaxis protein
VLERFGYQVILAEDDKQCVELFSQRPEAFSLVLLDLTMPVMSGEEALGHLLRLNPNAKVLIISGYDENDTMRKFGDLKIAGFLQKPFTAGHLIQKILEVLTTPNITALRGSLALDPSGVSTTLIPFPCSQSIKRLGSKT